MNLADFPFLSGAADRATAAKALAAVGVLAAHARAEPLSGLDTGTALLPALGAALDAAGTEPTTVDLRRDVTASGRRGALPAVDVLAMAWDHALQGRALPRLALRLPPGADPRWLVQQLSLPAVGAASVFVDPGSRAGQRGWSFADSPGVMVSGDEALAAGVAAELASLRKSRADAEHVRFVESADAPDVLVLATPFDGAAAALRAAEMSPVLLVVPSMPAGDWAPTAAAALQELRLRTATGAVVLSSVEPSHLAAWIADLVTRLPSEPIDVAVVHASAMAPGTALLTVNRSMLRRTRPAEVRRRPIRQSLAPAMLQLAVRFPFRRRQLAMMAPTRPSRSHMYSDAIAAFPSTWAADGGGGGGGPGVEMEGAADMPEPAPAPPPEPQPRFIQTRITARSDHAPGTRARRVRAFLPNALHTIQVRIGPQSSRWSSARVRFPALPDADQPQPLTVVMTAPGLLTEPQVAHITLPPYGASDACRFHLRTPERGEVHARIVVLHRGRIVQTATLSGTVGGVEGAELRAEPEMHIRGLDGLASRSEFDAALLVNHTADGTPTVTSIAKGGAAASVWSLQGIQDWMATTRARIEAMVTAPDKYATLDSPDSTELLWTLAVQGAVLYNALVMDNATRETRPIWDAARLQVVSARSESYLPLEFAYTRPAPQPNAPLCPNARAALRTGACQAGCPKDVATVVCPLRFWGLSKVIERHPYDPEHLPGNVRADFEVRSDPIKGRDRLGSFDKATLATSANVDEFDPNATQTLCTQLGARLVGGAAVPTWQAWRTTIAAEAPQLLVLLPHNDLDEHGLDALFIGSGDSLPAGLVTPDIVGDPEQARVVLLLGCRTGATTVPFEAYPAVFRRAGAALVVTALSSILGRHAAPVAASLVDELVQHAAAKKSAAFGDVLLDVRRKLMAGDRLMAMVLIAYGDADWRLGREP